MRNRGTPLDTEGQFVRVSSSIMTAIPGALKASGLSLREIDTKLAGRGELLSLAIGEMLKDFPAEQRPFVSACPKFPRWRDFLTCKESDLPPKTRQLVDLLHGGQSIYPRDVEDIARDVNSKCFVLKSTVVLTLWDFGLTKSDKFSKQIVGPGHLRRWSDDNRLALDGQIVAPFEGSAPLYILNQSEKMTREEEVFLVINRWSNTSAEIPQLVRFAKHNGAWSLSPTTVEALNSTSRLVYQLLPE